MTSLLYLAAILVTFGLVSGLRNSKGFQKEPNFLWIPILSPIIIACFVHAGYRAYATHDVEHWTSFCKSVVYVEDWMETIVTTDAKGRLQTRTVYHPPDYHVVDMDDHRTSIDRDNYERITKKFGQEPSHSFMTGRIHTHPWNKKEDVAEIVVTAHSYSNPTLAGDNSFSYPKISEDEVEQNKLFRRPVIKNYIHSRSIMGLKTEYDECLDKFNARYGAKHQIRVLLLIFQDVPIETAVLQEAYWRGGKKNELVLCVGLNNEQKVSWAKAFSWTEVESIKADFVNVPTLGEPLKLAQIMEWLETDVKQKWKRKEFKDFKYLTVDIPMWAIVMYLFISIGLNAVAALVVNSKA